MAADPITAGLNLGDDLIGLIRQVCPDPKAQQQLIASMQDKLLSVAQASDATQAQIIAAEAAQKGLINKPHLAAAWLCLGALFCDLILSPIVMWAAYALGYPIPAPPRLSNDTLSTLLFAVFGLGGISVAHGLTKQWMAS